MDRNTDRTEEHEVTHRDWPRRRRSSLDPYCSFRSDKERRLALRSRDLRFVAIAALNTVAIVVLFAFGGQDRGKELWTMARDCSMGRSAISGQPMCRSAPSETTALAEKQDHTAPLTETQRGSRSPNVQ